MDYKKNYYDYIAYVKTLGRKRSGTHSKNYIYYEVHHIIPRCFGGEGEKREWKTHPNLVLLTAREHYLAHYLLWKMYPNNKKIFLGFEMMQWYNNETKEKHKIICSKQVERLKIESNFHKSKKYDWNEEVTCPSCGKIHKHSFSIHSEYCCKECRYKKSEETKKKISLSKIGNTARLGMKNSDEHNRKVSEAHKGSHIPDYVREKIRNSLKGHEPPNKNISKFGKVRCIETGEIFLSPKDAIKKYKKAGHLVEVCLGSRNNAGGYHWEFVKE